MLTIFPVMLCISLFIKLSFNKKNPQSFLLNHLLLCVLGHRQIYALIACILIQPCCLFSLCSMNSRWKTSKRRKSTLWFLWTAWKSTWGKRKKWVVLFNHLKKLRLFRGVVKTTWIQRGNTIFQQPQKKNTKLFSYLLTKCKKGKGGWRDWMLEGGVGEEDGCKVGEGQSVRCIIHHFSLYQFFSSAVRSLSAFLCPYFPVHSYLKTFVETRKFLFFSFSHWCMSSRALFSPVEHFVNATLCLI